MTTPLNHRSKIVCTIGPACWEAEQLRQLILAGMNVARINFSHAEYESTARTILTIRTLAEAEGCNVAILGDLQGPRIRMGEIAAPISLQAGAEFILYSDPHHSADSKGAPMDYPALPREVQPGNLVLIDDGLVQLSVVETGGDWVRTQVLIGGLVGSHKGINVPGVTLGVPTITDKDRADLAFALDQGVDIVALSFVRVADDIHDLKRLIRQHGAAMPLVMAKIEKHEAVRPENFAGILTAADGIMVARGDLGSEMPTEELPILQKWMISQCNIAGKPVITATQMLDSMIRNPRPTRAEATDVANAIFDGTDATMLSGETASGKYPLAAVQTMGRIAARAEQAFPHEIWAASHHLRSFDKHFTLDPESAAVLNGQNHVTEAVCQAISEIATELGARAIVTITRSGYTARHIARYRPAMPILAITDQPTTRRQLALTWGVEAYLVPVFSSTDEMLAAGVQAAQQHGMVQPGDLIVISAGLPLNVPGNTNMIKVHTVGEKV